MKYELKLMISKKGGDRSHFGSNISSLLYGASSTEIEGISEYNSVADHASLGRLIKEEDCVGPLLKIGFTLSARE